MGKVAKFLNKAAKKVFTKSNVKGLVNGLAAAGQEFGVPADVTSRVGNSVVDAAYGTNFKKKGALAGFARSAMDGLSSAAADSGVEGAGFKKGSKKAKEHMARLRAMKKGGGGGRSSGGSKLSKIFHGGSLAHPTGPELMSMGMDRVSGNQIARWNVGRTAGKGFVPLGH